MALLVFYPSEALGVRRNFHYYDTLYFVIKDLYLKDLKDILLIQQHVNIIKNAIIHARMFHKTSTQFLQMLSRNTKTRYLALPQYSESYRYYVTTRSAR